MGEIKVITQWIQTSFKLIGPDFTQLTWLKTLIPLLQALYPTGFKVQPITHNLIDMVREQAGTPLKCCVSYSCYAYEAPNAILRSDKQWISLIINLCNVVHFCQST